MKLIKARKCGFYWEKGDNYPWDEESLSFVQESAKHPVSSSGGTATGSQYAIIIGSQETLSPDSWF